MKSLPPRRRGYTMFVVLALAAFLSALAVGWAREAVRGHQTSKLLHLQSQADWLMHAGFSRAAAKLVVDADYSGETWLVTANQLGQSLAAEVLIEKVDADETTAIRCRVRMPPGDNCRVQLTHSLALTSAQSASESADQGESE